MIGIASDHAGYTLKQYIIESMPDIDFYDYGCQGHDSVDYPDYAALLCADMVSGKISQGILICGTGIGMSIFANKYDMNIRASLCHDVRTATLTRQHNDSNVLCMGESCIGPDIALEMVRTWLNTPFSLEGRHQMRLSKITDIIQDK